MSGGDSPNKRRRNPRAGTTQPPQDLDSTNPMGRLPQDLRELSALSAGLSSFFFLILRIHPPSLHCKCSSAGGGPRPVQISSPNSAQTGDMRSAQALGLFAFLSFSQSAPLTSNLPHSYTQLQVDQDPIDQWGFHVVWERLQVNIESTSLPNQSILMYHLKWTQMNSNNQVSVAEEEEDLQESILSCFVIVRCHGCHALIVVPSHSQEMPISVHTMPLIQKKRVNYLPESVKESNTRSVLPRSYQKTSINHKH